VNLYNNYVVSNKKLIGRKPIMSNDFKPAQNSTNEQTSVDRKTFQEFKVVLENEVLTANARRKFLQTLFLGGVGVGIAAVTKYSLGQNVCFPENEVPPCSENENQVCHPESQIFDCGESQNCQAVSGLVPGCSDCETGCENSCLVECQSDDIITCIDCLQGPCPPPYGIAR
jgi:hypothetical protein